MAAPIYVDYDKTLSTGDGEVWWNDELDDSPRWDMIELVNDLYKMGHVIIIYTARREEVREATEYYLKKWGVMHHALKMEKPGYNMLIDDRAISDTKALDVGAEGVRDIMYGNE